jgi:hypothetical protein
MKRATKQDPRRQPPLPPRGWSGKKHLTVLVTALAAWLILFIIVLAENARSWVRLLPVIFVVLVVYGVAVTCKIVKESKH